MPVPGGRPQSLLHPPLVAVGPLPLLRYGAELPVIAITRQPPQQSWTPLRGGLPGGPLGPGSVV